MAQSGLRQRHGIAQAFKRLRYRVAGPFDPETPVAPRSPTLDPVLAMLKLAPDVHIEVNGEQRDTASLIKSGDHRTVRRYLWAKPPNTAAEHNNLGCAFAYARDWDGAESELETSKTKAANAQDETGEARASYNLNVVDHAKGGAAS
jgi:hypothetical protein